MTDPPELVGRYRVERLIAHGGMGSVYLARDPAIGRLVVIKFLKEGFDDASARERFSREARAAGRLHHPNIVTIFDVGEHENRPFIAMEYVAGETLAQLVGRRAVSRVWEKLGILEEVCAGLHYAHGASIVHRDIKPANVMRDQSGVVKILDFGIARGGGAEITRAGDVVGTLNYMSPEQLSGEDVDHRADIYSVGALAYELVTHQMAFPGTIQTGVLFKILNSAPVPIESLVPEIDPDITAMIERAMAREPDARYQDLETLRQDLAIVRTRLLEAAPEHDSATDPNVETRFESPRVTSGVHLRPPSRGSAMLNSSRGSGALKPSGRAITARPSAQVTSAPRSRRVLWLGAAAAILTAAVVWTMGPDWIGPADRSAQTEPAAPQRVEPPAPAAPPPGPVAAQPERPRTAADEQVDAARATARQQIVAGDRRGALDTLIGGLALDGKDPELNKLIDEMTGAARRSLTDARAAAVSRGADTKSSAAFREAQARDRETDRFVRTGERIPAMRAAWAATALYNKAPEGTGRKANALPPAPAPARPAGAPVEPPAKPVNQPGIGSKPSSGPPALPTTPKPEPPPVPRDPAREAPPDPRAADLSAIRETLRRYTQAYQSLDGAAVGRIMPSLTAEQLRGLDRDFANYRRYTVEIRNERIDVDGPSATVRCDVERSFETKTGVEGSNTVETTFHLRRNGAAWTIERLESR